MSEQINNTQTQEQKRSNKPLAVINVEAVVKEEPILKKIGKGADETELWETYVEVLSEYRQFNTCIYSKDNPAVTKGEQITIELTTYNYKLRFKRDE